MTKKARRHIPPIPLEMVMDDARVIALPVAGRGMLLNLVWHFWASDCAPMPKDVDRLFVIAHAHRPTWRAYQGEILAILRDVAPELQKAYIKRQVLKDQLRRLSHKGASATALAALRKKAPLECSSSPAPTMREDKRATRRAASAPIGGAGFSDKL